MPHLAYDDENMWSATAGSGGAGRNELRVMETKLLKAQKALQAKRKSGEQGFFDLPFDEESTRATEEAAARIRKSFKRLIVVGIGGSDLGARALIQALDGGEGVEVHFLGNPDPEVLETYAGQPASWWKKTAVNVVSKSGSTLETMAVFLFLRGEMVNAIGKKAHAKHVIATTDPGDGILFNLAQKNGYAILPHPMNVGGRFSVLSVVGLFPAACAGIPIRKILAGARSVQEAHDLEGTKHQSARFAALHALAYTKRGQRIHVLMPYAERLRGLGEWYRQIWAESLGKKRRGLFVGPTPVAAMGAVDQHSQIQLYVEGPKDKIVTFIRVERYRSLLKVPAGRVLPDGIRYIGGKRFERIMHAELDGTAKALAKHERPNGVLRIKSVTPESIGALLQFFELATAYTGELLGINVFDQPGVEEGKHYTRKILS